MIFATLGITQTSLVLLSLIAKIEIIKKETQNIASLLVSGYQDSNLGPPAPKAGALTGLRYIPF